jgi:hypothetical protein
MGATGIRNAATSSVKWLLIEGCADGQQLASSGKLTDRVGRDPASEQGGRGPAISGGAILAGELPQPDAQVPGGVFTVPINPTRLRHQGMAEPVLTALADVLEGRPLLTSRLDGFEQVQSRSQ